eukprot:6061040-Pleurochrysis_carterae.AAC.2
MEIGLTSRLETQKHHDFTELYFYNYIHGDGAQPPAHRVACGKGRRAVGATEATPLCRAARNMEYSIGPLPAELEMDRCEAYVPQFIPEREEKYMNLARASSNPIRAFLERRPCRESEEAKLRAHVKKNSAAAAANIMVNRQVARPEPHNYENDVYKKQQAEQCTSGDRKEMLWIYTR